MSRPICRYWQQGSCRFGDSCKFEHPGQNSNRFGVFGGGGGSSSSSTPAMTSHINGEPYGINKAQILKDLSDERPQWILSSYGPGRDAPEQLFGGYPTEQSFEELRLHHLKGVVAGNPQGAANEIDALYQGAQRRIQNAVDNVDAAVRFISDGEHKHPNRIDVCKNNSQPGGTNGSFAVGRPKTSSPFGVPAASASPFGSSSATPAAGGAFGQPSALGQKPSPFGTPAFGQATQPTSAFGQPTQLGGTSSPFGKQAQTAGSAFGQASALGQKPSPFGAPAFGQPAQPSAAASTPFGQAAQPSTATPAFGQPSQPGAAGGGFSGFAKLGGGSAFGQPSSLGQKSSPFGGAGAAGGASPFATHGAGPSAGAANPFGQPAPSSQSPFGAPTGPAASQPGVFGKPAPTSSPFGQPSAGATSTPFGQPSTAAASNPFGQPPAAANPFSQQQSDMSMVSQQKSDVSMDTSATLAPSPFGRPSGAAPTPTPNPFGSPSAPAAFGQPSQPGAANPFGGFSAPAAQQTQAARPATATGATGGPYAPNATRQHPRVESYSSRDATGALKMFKGKTVVQEVGKDGKPYPAVRNFDGTTLRIWFPDGPPMYYKDTELSDAAYDAETKAAYESFVGTGVFAGGIMPLLPPKREWCLFDF